MKIYSKLAASILIVFVCAAAAVFQVQDPAMQAQLWHSRADTISADILKETANINELDSAGLFAELGDAWWKVDADRANNWFTRSVDTIFFYSPENSNADLSKFFRTSRSILEHISDRNEKQTERLIKIISDVEKSSENDKDANADALIEFALKLAESDSRKALQLGELATRIGNPKKLYSLIWKLNKNSPEFAVRLFDTALSKARTEPKYYRLQMIQISAFPIVLIPEPPENIQLARPEKVKALNLLADVITQLSAKVLAKQLESCRSEATIAAALKTQFSEFLPERSGVVQQAIGSCRSGQSAQMQSLTDTIRRATVEELLKLADEHKDEPLLRTAYLYRAALLAHEEKRYALSITVLETMDEKERSSDIDFWEDLRSGAASHLAFEKYTAEDVQGANKVIADVPDPIEPFAQFGLVTLFSVDDAASLPFRLEVLSEARKNFRKSDKTFARKASYWFRLVGLFSDVGLQQDAADTFREVVKAFNADQSEKSATQIEISPEMVSGSFSPKLLEAMDSSILETVRLINKPQSRIDVNFALLRIALAETDRL